MLCIYMALSSNRRCDYQINNQEIEKDPSVSRLHTALIISIILHFFFFFNFSVCRATFRKTEVKGVIPPKSHEALKTGVADLNTNGRANAACELFFLFSAECNHELILFESRYTDDIVAFASEEYPVVCIFLSTHHII